MHEVLFVYCSCHYRHRMVHSFTCAGVLQAQYEKLSRFAGLGTSRNYYIQRGNADYVHHFVRCYAVYKQQGYMDLVLEAAGSLPNIYITYCFIITQF